MKSTRRVLGFVLILASIFILGTMTRCGKHSSASISGSINKMKF